MTKRVRKLIVYAVVGALAVANGIAPRLTHAANQEQVAGHSKMAAHQHHGGQARMLHADEVAGDSAGTADHGKAEPNHNCCAAACAPIANLFATVNIDRRMPRDVFDVPPTQILRPGAVFSIDPPPRTA